jgi:AraC family transcriptional regulator
MANLLPSPILLAVVPKPAILIRSSACLPWKGFLLEKYLSNPGERVGDSVDRQVLATLCSAASWGEHRAIDGKFVRYRKTLGALTIFPKGPVPELRLRKESEVLFCAFEEKFLSSVRDELDGRQPAPLDFRSGIHDRSIFQILNLLFAELESGGSSCELYAESLAHALAVRFLHLGQQIPQEVFAGVPALSYPKLSRVRELIESRLAETLSLEELAKESGYSRSHFLRTFRAATGMTPHAYVLKERVERARRLLSRSDVSCAEIAYSCGFSSQAHMSAAFRKDLGRTPGEYRQEVVGARERSSHSEIP